MTARLRPALGLALAVALGVVASVAGAAWPTLGAPVFAVTAGVLLSPLANRWRGALDRGIGLAKGPLLQVAVVLLGAQLSLQQVADVGLSSLPVMLGTLTPCLLLAVLLGRAMHIGSDLRTLIGVGTAICGASAIAAVTPTIRAKDPDTTYAISTIFLFNVLAVLAFPPLGHLLELSQEQFGLFAGTAVNDTSSVVAAAASYGSVAADHAVVVKLVRSLMIIPIVVGLAVLVRCREGVAESAGRGGRVSRLVGLVPWFLIAFVMVVAMNSMGWVPDRSHEVIRLAAVFLIATALAAIGLSTDVRALRRTGPKPMVLGLVLWGSVTSTSLLLIWLTGDGD
ncbi:conserved hypothetical integral membrane protein [Blastococcus mobilis]|uniref:Conserved hypothetical integral membrane protein n=1 Tax=Blastococcus mobilis TaxID=1938746 RepID=A0A239ABC5_9ACTN|nr:conserved hypothetical integral membrane protein [Blastococcus mobilis]